MASIHQRMRRKTCHRLPTSGHNPQISSGRNGIGSTAMGGHESYLLNPDYGIKKTGACHGKTSRIAQKTCLQKNPS